MPEAEVIFLLVAIAIVSCTASGATGIGGLALLMPWSLILLSPAASIALGCTAAAVMNATIILKREDHRADHAELRTMLLGVLPGAVAGFVILSHADKSQLQLLLGAFTLIATAILAWIQWRGVRRTVNGRWGTLAGGLFATFNTSLGTGGPPVASYLLLRHIEPSSQRMTTATFFLFCAPLALPGLIVLGLEDQALQGFALGLLCAPSAIVGVSIGKALFLRMSTRIFRYLTIGLIAISGLASIASGVGLL